LIAPVSFYEKFKAECGLFDRYISYEDISAFVPEFGAAAAPSARTSGAAP